VFYFARIDGRIYACIDPFGFGRLREIRMQEIRWFYRGFTLLVKSNGDLKTRSHRHAIIQVGQLFDQLTVL
jgi:hypothetical protein